MPTKGTFSIVWTDKNGIDTCEVTNQPGLDALDALMRVKQGYDHLSKGDYRVSCNA